MSGTWGMIGGTLVGQGSGSEADQLRTVSNSGATTITAHTTAHTKGAWTELIASTAAATTLLWVTVTGVGQNATSTATLLDIAVGAGGAEVPVVENVPIGGADSASGGRTWSLALPVAVASGARVSARIQSVVAGGKTATIAIAALAGGAHTPSESPLVTLGSSTSTSAGTALSGSWTEISASTPAAYRYLIPVPALDTATAAGTTVNLEIGTGAGGSEVAAGSIAVSTLATEFIFAPQGTPAWAATQLKPGCAAGTRIAARAHADVACAVIGVL